MKQPMGVELAQELDPGKAGRKSRRSFRLPADSLSPREAEVCLLLREGLLVKEIAGRLGISCRTAEQHTRNLYQKLNVRSRAGLFKRFETCHSIEVRPAARDSDVVQIFRRLEKIEEQLNEIAEYLRSDAKSAA
jgi:DNA-binding CsgD family transcriptional regulator